MNEIQTYLEQIGKAIVKGNATEHTYRPALKSRRSFIENFISCKNLALCALRRPRNEIVGNFFVTETITDKCVISSLDNAQIFPLYLYADDNHTLFGVNEPVRKPNYSDEFIRNYRPYAKNR